MVIFKKLFNFINNSSEQQQNNAVGVSSVNKKTVEEGDKNVTIPTSFPEAILYVVKEKGRDYLCQREFIDMLDDYHLFKELPALKNILTCMLSEGYIQKLVSTKSWEYDAANIVLQYVNAYGTKEEILDYIVKSFGYGLNHSITKPSFGEIDKTSLSQKQKNEKQPITQIKHNLSTNSLKNVDSLNTLLNPKEPFLTYKYPTLNLLKAYENDSKPYIDERELKANKEQIEKVLNSFNVQIREIKATVGPTITLYEITPAEGVRISHIRNLEDDIALSLAALGIRIIAPIPGKGTIGIEVPNAKPNIVSMRSILDSKKFQVTPMDLPIALGKTITNEVFMVDLAKIPHLLVAGATGQGKSVGLNAIITSLLYKKHPNELKFVLIDPKKVEFSVYAPIAPHFMATVDDDDDPIITDVTKVVRTLKSLCTLMDQRYDMLKVAKVRTVKEYNKKYVNHELNPAEGHEYMPYIVVVIDEFDDLIMTAGKEIELPITRIAQLARAVGIHMVIATSRPTTSIITGNIKANFPGRMAFKVSAMVDSRTILDRPGANQLVGRGDMLFLSGSDPVRVQCAFIDTPEVETVNDYIAHQPGPASPLELPEPASEDTGMIEGSGGMVEQSSIDPLFAEAAHAIVLTQQGSMSMIQRRFSIGYNRAGRLMDQLEKAGVVGQAQGSKPRDVLLADENSLHALLSQMKI